MFCDVQHYIIPNTDIIIIIIIMPLIAQFYVRLAKIYRVTAVLFHGL